MPRSAPTTRSTPRRAAASRCPADQMLPITPSVSDGREYGLHPAMPELQQLFQQRPRSPSSTTSGPLLAPVTQGRLGRGPRRTCRRNLFSHNDQQVQWQTSVPDEDDRHGLGRTRRPTCCARSTTTTRCRCRSRSAGTNTFQVGGEVFQFQVSPGGGSSLERLHARAARPTRPRSRSTASSPASTPTSSRTPTATSMQRVRRRRGATAGRASPRPDARDGRSRTRPRAASSRRSRASSRCATRSGHRRQIFFCAAGGYDTHGDQVQNQAACSPS